MQAALERAAAVCGLVTDDGWPSVRRTIASGFRKGLSEPRDLTREIKARQSRNPVPNDAEWRQPSRKVYQLVSTPTLRADGSVLDKAGYDALSGLYLTSSLKGLSVPERSTEDDAQRANETLTALLRGFPFSGPDEHPGLLLAVAMAGLLGSVVRATLPFAPMTGITAPKAGTGKSYLIDLFAIISTGSRAACVATGGDSKEFEKALGAALIDGRALLSLDNMVQPIQGQLLCQVLSQQRAEVRVLGLSKMARPSTSVAIFATGNNLEVKGDMTRRILICKLDARKEHPEHRTFDGDLIAEAIHRRPELVSAVLTILKWRHCWQEDAPDPWERVAAATPLANYEDWFQRVCAPIDALGHVNPVLSVGQGRTTDSSESALIALLEAWHARFGEEPKTCRAAIDLATTTPLQAELLDTNCYHAYPAHAAFGGYKQSGIGREDHKMMLNHYQQTKNLLVSYSPKALGFF